MLDEAHATGFIGPNGIGTPDLFGVSKDIDIINGTFGKGLLFYYNNENKLWEEQVVVIQLEERKSLNY